MCISDYEVGCISCACLESKQRMSGIIAPCDGFDDCHINACRANQPTIITLLHWSASWARFIAKVYDVDSLTRRKCGGTLKIVAYLHDTVSIRRILDHLGLSEPEDERPPSLDVRYVPVDDEGREIAMIS
jgi:hypothetical protein